MNQDEGHQAELEQQEQQAMPDIIETLRMIQVDLKAPKSQRNDFGKYNYRTCGDILEALKPFLNEHECAIVMGDEIILIGDRYYVKATAELRRGNQMIGRSAFAREEATKKGMDAAQITGACSSYARKYALNALFAIDDTKDADATNDHGDSNIKELYEKTQTALTNGDWITLCEIDQGGDDADEWKAVWGKLTAPNKKLHKEITAHRIEYRDMLDDFAATEDDLGAGQLVEELGPRGGNILWRILKPETQQFLKKIKEKAE